MQDARGGSKLILLLVLVVVAAVGGASYYLYTRQRSEIPVYTELDAASNGQAGKVERMTGNGSWRAGPGAPEAPLQAGTAFPVGTIFHVKQGATVEMLTNGNWQVVIDGEGDFVFEDARRDTVKKAHAVVWTVRKGMIRAKPHDYDPSDHWLEVRTPKARIFVHKGEIGARISEGGSGTVWLVKGQAEVVWEDGRRRKLEPSDAMEYL